MRAATLMWLVCAMCERSGAAADDESGVPEPAVAAPGAGLYVGCECEARHLASHPPPGVKLWQLPKWFPGKITAINEHTHTCDVHYKDGDVEKGVRFEYVRPRAPRAAAAAQAPPAATAPAAAAIAFGLEVGLAAAGADIM